MKPLETVTLVANSAPKNKYRRFVRIGFGICIFLVLGSLLICGIIRNVDHIPASSSTVAHGHGNDTESSSSQNDQPNIILIMMDDLGFTDAPHYSNPIASNDYSFTTPNLERFAAEGIRLNYHYSEPVCSATRSALLSGRYAWRTGLDTVISTATTAHTQSNLPFISEVLKDQYGYHTMMTGKWHVGYKNETLLPMSRGFDHAMWFTGGGIGYHSHSFCQPWSYYDAAGHDVNTSLLAERDALFGVGRQCFYDLWNNRYFPIHNDDYSEEQFADRIIQYISNSDPTEPFFVYYAMQTPHSQMTVPPFTWPSRCAHITDSDRQTFCQMMQFADFKLGQIVQTVESQGIMDNTIFIFLSDNGGVGGPGAMGQNLPLRGRKNSKFEGGVRTPSFIFGGYLNRFLSDLNTAGCDYDNLVYVSDWWPMILQMISQNTLRNDVIQNMYDLDGLGLLSNILNECGHIDPFNEDNTLRRDEILSIRMCQNAFVFGSYIRKEIDNVQWKMVINSTASCPGLTGPSAVNYYYSIDNTQSRVPNEEIYEQYMTDSNLRQYIGSRCYDQMNNVQRQNVDNFEYEEVMLFRIEEDAIEACNVAAEYPEIVEELMETVTEKVMGHYDGSYPTEPVAGAVLKQYEMFSCEYDTGYIMAWEESVNSTFDDWNAVWREAINQKKACSSAISQ